METTSGLVSAYQTLDYSAQRIAAYNLSVTNAEMVSVNLVPIPDLFKRPEELLKAALNLRETIYSEVYQTMIASERVLARDWDQPDEDEAWRGL